MGRDDCQTDVDGKYYRTEKKLNKEERVTAVSHADSFWS